MDFAVTLTRRRYGPSGKFGRGAVIDETDIPGWVLAQAGSVERVNGEDVTLEQDTAYNLSAVDILPTDELAVPTGAALDAGVYQVDGKPMRYVSPFSGQGPTVVRLTRAAG